MTDLQDLGYELGCPAGVKIADYLRLRVKQAQRAEKTEAALHKINTIRNSIIGLQKINWSEHIYPLVAALDEAGMEGMEYPEALGMFGTMLERTNRAEAENAKLREALERIHKVSMRASSGERYETMEALVMLMNAIGITAGRALGQEAGAALLQNPS